MGYINENILEYISSKHPELSSLRVELGEKEITFNTVESILPYLAYTNSLDSHHRLINLFHSPFSEHHKLIPFYIVLAICKREIKRFEQNIKPINNGLVIRYKGSRYELREIDINKQLVHLSDGKGQTKIPFLDFLTSDVQPYHQSYKKEYLEVTDLINRYRLTKTKSIKRIFDTPLYSNKKPQSGVIIFTPKVKFKELFNSLTINGQAIKNKVPTVNAKYLHDKKRYKYDFISKTNSNYPLILFTNYLDIKAVGEFKRNFPYLDTLVFDEVEDNYSELEKVLSSHYSKLENELRDIYLLISDEKIDLLNEIESKVDESHKWLAKSSNEQNSQSMGYEVILLTDNDYNNTYNSSHDLHYQFRRLFKQFNPQNVLPIYSSYCKLLIRYISFCSPEDFKTSAWDFIEEFEDFTKDYLQNNSSLYEDFINSINKSVLSLIDSDQNKKVERVVNYIEELDLSESDQLSVGIIARNDNESDKKHLLQKLSNYPIKLNIISYSDLEKAKKIKGLDIIFLLEFRKPLSTTLFTNQFAYRQVLILSEKEFGYYKNKHYKVGNLINKITSHNNRKKILNLTDEEAETLVDYNYLYNLNVENYLNNKEELSDSNSIKDEAEGISNKEETDFNDLIIEAYKENVNSKKDNSYTDSRDNHRPDLLIVFKDGITELSRNTQQFYRLSEESINNINDLKIQAKNLKQGDEILKIKLDDTNLTDLFIKKLHESNNFREIFHQAERWRESLKYLYDKVGSQKACELISKHFNRSETTIENWYHKDTLVPQSHKKVINALNEISNKANFRDMPYISDPEKVITSASTIKGLVLKLPSILLNISIRDLYDLPKKFDLDEAEQDLADEIYKHLEIKRIDIIEKL